MMSKTIDQIPKEDRPREKLLAKGAAALSDQELLAVLLGKGTPGMDVMTLAGKLARLIDEKGLKVAAEAGLISEGKACSNDSRALDSATRSCGRLGPASEGSTEPSSSLSTSVNTGSGVLLVRYMPCALA